MQNGSAVAVYAMIALAGALRADTRARAGVIGAAPRWPLGTPLPERRRAG